MQMPGHSLTCMYLKKKKIAQILITASAFSLSDTPPQSTIHLPLQSSDRVVTLHFCLGLRDGAPFQTRAGLQLGVKQHPLRWFY